MTSTFALSSASQPMRYLSGAAMVLALAVGAVAQTTATLANYGTGCGVECADSFFEAFPNAASFDLANSAAFTMIPSAGSYIVVPGGSLMVAPSGSAVALPLGNDGQVNVSLSTPFPSACDGLVSQLTVCSNGFVSVAPGNGTSAIANVAQMLSSPQSAWWSWHDFDPSLPGSGKVKFEEIGNIAYVTWEQVWEAGGTSAANANTFQFQFDLATGNVQLVHGDMHLSGSGPVVGYSPGGVPLRACELDLSAITPITLCCASMGIVPLQLDVLDRPVVGTTPRFVTSNIPPCTFFVVNAFGFAPIVPLDLTPFMPGCFLLHDLGLLFGTPVSVTGSTVQTNYFLLNPVPNLLGLQVCAQSVAWVGGVQTAISSNAVSMVIGDQ